MLQQNSTTHSEVQRIVLDLMILIMMEMMN